MTLEGYAKLYPLPSCLELPSEPFLVRRMEVLDGFGKPLPLIDFPMAGFLATAARSPRPDIP